jgi:hypothetical protein
MELTPIEQRYVAETGHSPYEDIVMYEGHDEDIHTVEYVRWLEERLTGLTEYVNNLEYIVNFHIECSNV